MDFSNLNKQSANSFHKQKNLLKKLMQGQLVNCPHCKQTIKLYLPEDNVKARNNKNKNLTIRFLLNLQIYKI